MALWIVTTRSLGGIMEDLVDVVCTWDLNKRKFASLVRGSEAAATELKGRRCVVSVEPAVDGEYRDDGDFDDMWVYVVYNGGRRWRRVPASPRFRFME